MSISLSNDAARRVARSVRATERAPVARSPLASRFPRIATPGKFAITASTITAGNQTTKQLGSGTGTLQVIRPVTRDGVTTYPYAAVPSIANVVILNGGAAIASGRLIQVKYIDGFWVVDVDYC